MPSTNYAYVNGRFVPEAEATVSIFDRGFLYGDGCFETMRVYDGKIFRLYPHLQRLFDGLHCLEVESPLSHEETRAMLSVLIRRNQIADGFVRVYVTRGEGDIGLRATDVRRRTLVALACPREFRLAHKLEAIVATPRLTTGLALTQVKSANRLPYILARLEADRMGVHEAVLLNEHGHVAEFTASNVFAVKSGELFTPPLEAGALPGITRSVVLMLAGKLGLVSYELGFGPEFLETADEVFATNSLSEIAPIVEFNGHKLPSQVITQQLQAAYRELVREELGLC